MEPASNGPNNFSNPLAILSPNRISERGPLITEGWNRASLSNPMSSSSCSNSPFTRL